MTLRSTATTSGAVSVLTSSTVVAAANPARRELTVVNDHATQVVYLQLATSAAAPTAVASQGIRLNAAGGSYTTNTYLGPVAGISVGGTSVVTVTDV